MNRLSRGLTILITGFAGLILLPVIALAANLLSNGNFESFSNIGRTWRDYEEKAGTGWNHFYIASGTELDRLHWFSSQDFASAFGGLNYRLEGDSAQNMWSSYQFDAGVYQRVTGLVTDTVYAFDVPVVTFWRGPGYPVSDGMMRKQIGIDPYGGTDPSSANVIWGESDSNDKEWVYLDLSARAQSSAMTFFVRIQAPENDSSNHTDLDMVYIDAAKVDLAPTVTLTATASGTDVTFSWVGSAAPGWSASPHSANPHSATFSWVGSAAPGWSLKGVEVGYKDIADGQWQSIQGKTGGADSSHTFTGQAGHIYTVRARPWQTTTEGYNSDIDMPGLWTEKSATVPGAFNGYVRNNYGMGVSGATVSVIGASTSSQSAGFYALQPPAYGQPFTLTVSASDYGSPPSISGTVASADNVTPITLTLKPANDVIINGDFESGTSGWATSGTGSIGVFGGPDHHNGEASLAMTGTVTLTQTAVLSGVHNPTLSFWHSPSLAASESFTASLSQGGTLLASRTFTSSAPAEWGHEWLSFLGGELFTGSLTASFQLAGGEVYLDEVSLGDGPRLIYLPLIMRSAQP